MVLTNYDGDFWNEFPIFSDLFFENFKFTMVAYGYKKTQLSGKRAIVEQNGLKFGPLG